MLYEFILKLSAKNAWRGQFLRVSKSIWRVKCIAKSHEIEDEFYDFILTKQAQPPRVAPQLRGLDATHFAQRSYVAAQPAFSPRA